MKTGFLYGGARIPKFVYYYYHGKIMQCRKEPWIPPYIYYDTHPAEYPPNYYYECDTMPNGATPPMTTEGERCVIITIGGGLYDLKTRYCPWFGTTYASYYWLINPTAKLEITALFPTLEILDPATGAMTGSVYLNAANTIGVYSMRLFKLLNGHTVLDREETKIKKDWRTEFSRPFTNNIHIFFEKIFGTNKWNFYFNDEWIFDIINPTINRTSFMISGPSHAYGHGTLDYIRAWKDTERF